MALLPIAGPPLPTSHAVVDPQKLIGLAQKLSEHAAGKRVTLAMVDAVAAAEKVPRAHVYAAMAMDPNLVFAVEQETLLAVCVGGCQAQGALTNLEALLRE